MKWKNHQEKIWERKNKVMEFLAGTLLGLCIGSIFAKWCFLKQLEYKADTKIDMCEGGRFYTIRRNLERENNNEN